MPTLVDITVTVSCVYLCYIDRILGIVTEQLGSLSIDIVWA